MLNNWSQDFSLHRWHRYVPCHEPGWLHAGTISIIRTKVVSLIAGNMKRTQILTSWPDEVKNIEFLMCINFDI